MWREALILDSWAKRYRFDENQVSDAFKALGINLLVVYRLGLFPVRQNLHPYCCFRVVRVRCDFIGDPGN